MPLAPVAPPRMTPPVVTVTPARTVAAPASLMNRLLALSALLRTAKPVAPGTRTDAAVVSLFLTHHQPIDPRWLSVPTHASLLGRLSGRTLAARRPRMRLRRPPDA